jgi:3-mercaptopyruvate sulfurtransferase SseA
MNCLRLPAQSFFLILVTSLLISCGVSSVSVAPTATPEPPTPAPTEDQIPTSYSEVPRISPEELKERLDNGEAILVVDVRGAADFEFWHIAGAISVPSYDVESRLDELPRDKELVLYCT